MNILTLVIGISFIPLVALQWFALVWPLTGQPMSKADEKALVVMQGVFWFQPVWGVICLLNFIWPEWIGINRYLWIIATFIPILLMLLIMTTASFFEKK